MVDYDCPKWSARVWMHPSVFNPHPVEDIRVVSSVGLSRGKLLGTFMDRCTEVFTSLGDMPSGSCWVVWWQHVQFYKRQL